MIYPSQETQLKRFFEVFLEKYKNAPEKREKGCQDVESLVARAEELLDMLTVECAGVERRTER